MIHKSFLSFILLPTCVALVAADPSAATTSSTTEKKESDHISGGTALIREVEFERDIDFNDEGLAYRESQRLSLSLHVRDFSDQIIGFVSEEAHITGAFSANDHGTVPAWSQPTIRISASRNNAQSIDAGPSSVSAQLSWSSLATMPLGNDAMTIHTSAYILGENSLQSAVLKDLAQYTGVPLTFPGVDGLALTIDTTLKDKVAITWDRSGSYKSLPFTAYSIKFFSGNGSKIDLGSYSGRSNGNAYTRTYRLNGKKIDKNATAHISILTSFNKIPVTIELAASRWQKTKRTVGKEISLTAGSPEQSTENKENKVKPTLSVKPAQKETAVEDF